MKSADTFERRFIGQGEYEDRTIDQTLDLAWELLSSLPEGELKRCDPKTIAAARELRHCGPKTIEASRKAIKYKYMPVPA